MLKNERDPAIMRSLETARSECERMEKNYIISGYRLPEKPTASGYWKMYVPDATRKSGRRQISSPTLEGLKDKIYAHEKGLDESHCDRTVRDVFEIVQEEKLRYVKSETRRLSVNNTVARSRAAYKRFISGTALERMPISDVTKRDVEDLIMMNLERYDLRPKGLASLKGVLKPVFDRAYREYWIADNPYARIDFGDMRYRNMTADDVPAGERCHSAGDIGRMLDHIHESEGSGRGGFAPFALEIQIIMGLRRGEVPALKWDDIGGGCVTIRRELITVRSLGGSGERFEIAEHTKTHKNRKFPVTDGLREFLGRLRAEHRRLGVISPYLFPADTEAGCITNGMVYNFCYRMCGALGIPTSRELIKGTHAFRRTRITEVANKSGVCRPRKGVTDPRAIIIISGLFG